MPCQNRLQGGDGFVRMVMRTDSQDPIAERFIDREPGFDGSDRRCDVGLGGNQQAGDVFALGGDQDSEQKLF